MRGCGEPLLRDDARWACARGHSFDVARRGQVNLLQPQDRRSLDAGDSREAVAARARLLELGAGRALFEDLVNVVASLALTGGSVAVELGSGTGHLLAALERDHGLACIGIDLSSAAIEHAAREHAASALSTRVHGRAGAGSCTWVVANADRRLPLCDNTAALALSINGRRNPQEVERILAPGGHWLIAVPARDDLAELRQAIQGEAKERTRDEDIVAEVIGEGEAGRPTSRMTLARRGTSRTRVHLNQEALADLCEGTYRGLRTSAAQRVAALTTLEVTFASDWLLFQRT